jgi:hypothetical protein
MFGMSRVTGQSLLDLLVHSDIYLHTSLSRTLQDHVESPFLVEVGGTAQEQLWREPPVGDIDGLLGILKSDWDSPEVVTAIDIPFDLVVWTLWEVGLEAVRVAYGGPFAISSLLMFLVVAMVGVEEIPNLAQFVLEVNSPYLRIIELGICYLWA